MRSMAVQGKDRVENTNVVQKRLLLEKKEQELHELLTEYTRRLQNARAQVKLFEDSLEQTLKELHAVRQERNELTQLLDGAWNGQGAGSHNRQVNS